MKKTILSILALTAFGINAETTVQLQNIKVNSIYHYLAEQGHDNGQVFSVSYESFDGTFERSKEGQLVPVFVANDQGTTSAPNLGDKKSYTTTGENDGARYEYHYQYTYMEVDGVARWVLTGSHVVFLGLVRPGNNGGDH